MYKKGSLLHPVTASCSQQLQQLALFTGLIDSFTRSLNHPRIRKTSTRTLDRSSIMKFSLIGLAVLLGAGLAVAVPHPAAEPWNPPPPSNTCPCHPKHSKKPPPPGKKPPPPPPVTVNQVTQICGNGNSPHCCNSKSGNHDVWFDGFTFNMQCNQIASKWPSQLAQIRSRIFSDLMIQPRVNLLFRTSARPLLPVAKAMAASPLLSEDVDGLTQPRTGRCSAVVPGIWWA